MTILEAYKEFQKFNLLKGSTEKTIDYYFYCINPFLNFLSYDILVDSISADDISNYGIFLRHHDLSSNSIKTYTKGLKVFFNWLYRSGYTSVNLNIYLPLPKAQRKIFDILSYSELQRLLNHFDTSNFLGLRNICICALMFDSGLRRSEIINLKKSDYHETDGYIIVNGKGNKQRVVPLGEYSKAFLYNWYFAICSTFPEASSFFVSSSGLPITNSCIDRLFRTLKSDEFLNIPRIHAHLLRHTFATYYLESGGNIYDLQVILGHSSLEMVKKYLHLSTKNIITNFNKFSPLDNLKKSI